jgi:metal-responsive CopG/Arc/MetJ family transcriptional regulator
MAIRGEYMDAKGEKLTISIPKNLLAVADKMAAEMKISRSAAISLCIQEMADRRKENAMKGGYLAMAEQHRKIFENNSSMRRTLPERKQNDGK